MAVVYFTTIPFEPKAQPSLHKESHILLSICPCTKDIVGARFEDFATFQNFFCALLRFSCLKKYG